MEEGEEGTEKKVSATTGFITGQLMMFISIYYAPLHLALESQESFKNPLKPSEFSLPLNLLIDEIEEAPGI
ncbi:hypothetical protein ACLB2K_052590 [Fragaria x ananassa]